MKKIILASLFLASCSGPSLTDQAHKVLLRKQITDKQKSEYVVLTSVLCEKGANFRLRESNRDSCGNYLRNEAGVMGGDLVITDEGQHPKSWAWGERCNNCVQVMGTVYRKKTVDEKKAEKKKEEALAAAKAEKLGPDRQPAAIGAIPGASAQDEAPLAETKPTLEQMFPPKQETSHVVDEVLKSR